jgi:arylformamidase
MGHSAAAHFVALLATAPAISSAIVSTPWLGAILLDGATLDVVKLMKEKHARFYNRAFGRDPEYRKSASPFHAPDGGGRPILLVCSSRRGDSCEQARRFAAKASSAGMRATVLEQDLSHRDVNRRLGEKPDYTQAVESFIASLDASAAKAFSNRSGVR